VLDWLLTVPPAYRWLFTLALIMLVIVLSVTPGVPRPGDSLFEWLVINTATPVQKLLHVVIYALLAMAWMWSLASVDSLAGRLLLSLLLTVMLGVVLEWCQTMVPGRFGTLSDVILNAIGAAIGLAIAALLL